MRPLTSDLKEVDPVVIHRQSAHMFMKLEKKKLYHISKNPS